MKFVGVKGENTNLTPRGWYEVNPHQYDEENDSYLGKRKSPVCIRQRQPSDQCKGCCCQSKIHPEYGQLSPITVVKGEDVYLSGGHLVDLDGNDIPDEQTENYLPCWTVSTV